MSKSFFVLLGIVSFVIPSEVNASYKSELRHVTKQGNLYEKQDFDAKLLWHATLLTNDYRRARAEEHVTLHHLGPVEASRWIAEEGRNQEKGWEFVLSLYTKSDYKDFRLGGDSFWEILLTTDDGKVVQPTSIESLPVTPYIKLLYPHVHRWSKVYRIVFPKVALGKQPKLTLQSVVGSSHLKWNLR